MVFGKIRDAWKKRTREHLVKNAGEEEWCTFARALCGSADNCHGFPYQCKACFDTYYNPADVLECALKHESSSYS